jgi:hypothetical protein
MQTRASFLFFFRGAAQAAAGQATAAKLQTDREDQFLNGFMTFCMQIELTMSKHFDFSSATREPRPVARGRFNSAIPILLSFRKFYKIYGLI